MEPLICCPVAGCVTWGRRLTSLNLRFLFCTMGPPSRLETAHQLSGAPGPCLEPGVMGLSSRGSVAGMRGFVAACLGESAVPPVLGLWLTLPSPTRCHVFLFLSQLGPTNENLLP